MSKACVLLSGGVDSTTCLHHALSEYHPSDVVALSVNYGQRHGKELSHALASAAAAGTCHIVLDLASVIPQTMLTNPKASIPNVDYADIQGVSPTYVPFRNGLMLSAAASWFHGFLLDVEGDTEWEESCLYFGAHAEDAHNWAYPDCTPEFIGAMANLIFIGTYQRIRLRTPLQWLNKKGVIELGTKLGVDWARTWSCYKGGSVHCGECPTCRSRRKGFIEAGVYDPTEYAVTPD